MTAQFPQETLRLRPAGFNRSGLKWLDGEREDVPDAALRPDHARRARVDLELPAQPQNLDIYAAVEDVFMDPRGLKQMLARQWSARRVEEREQQRILTLG